MSENAKAIVVSGVGKRYYIGRKQEGSFRHAIAGLFRSQLRSGSEFWALRDISFEIGQGEAVGIIGKNGAGKSTLLKILSSITKPTTGSIELYGRVASLLEVGTGFHAELTGRENIFLNGTILGMSREEVRKKFDEIVDFSGVEKFLDTPVKHYSSGMTVRLAFAVAAHLEPEILVVDEVLAVGDSEFQKKCLGKMESVSRNEGRTVLFVSHNMATIKALCTKGIYLENGRVIQQGDIASCISRYLSSGIATDNDLSNRDDRKGNGRIRYEKWELADARGSAINSGISGETLRIHLYTRSNADKLQNVLFWLQFKKDGAIVFTCHNQLSGTYFDVSEGVQKITCEIPRLPLFSGKYTVDLLCLVNGEFSDYLTDAFTVEIENGDFFGSGRLPQEQEGFLIENTWSVE